MAESVGKGDQARKTDGKQWWAVVCHCRSIINIPHSANFVTVTLFHPMSRLLATIPILLSDSLGDDLQLHQFPLLSRPLEVPPSARLAGKKITSRRKNDAGRMEIRLPLDLRQDIWNKERGLELGDARAQDDNPAIPAQQQPGEENRLTHLRLRSELVPDRAASSYMIGVLHENVLHLHPVSEIHQFKPSLTYLDVLSRPTRRKASDSDDSEDDGPPPDPDEPVPAPAPKAKKEKGKEVEAKEITVSAKKADDANLQGGLSTMRREMLLGMRKEQEEAWVDYDFSAVDVRLSSPSHIVCSSIPVYRISRYATINPGKHGN